MRLTISDTGNKLWNENKCEYIHAKDLPKNTYLIDGDGSRDGLWILYNLAEYSDGVYFEETEYYFDSIKEAKEYIKSIGGKLYKHYNSSY